MRLATITLRVLRVPADASPRVPGPASVLLMTAPRSGRRVGERAVPTGPADRASSPSFVPAAGGGRVADLGCGPGHVAGYPHALAAGREWYPLRRSPDRTSGTEPCRCTACSRAVDDATRKDDTFPVT